MVLKICVIFSLLIGIACIHVLAFPKLGEDLKVNKAGNTPQGIEDELIIARQILERVPLIDGHNDFPFSIRKYQKGEFTGYNITDLTETEPWNDENFDKFGSHTDILRLRQGKVGAQFWVSYTRCASQYKDAPQKAFEQIDLIHRMIEHYPETFELATTAQEIEDVFAKGKIASLIGIEGGHAIGDSLALLRNFYRLGARYLTLTHSCTTSWADNSQLDDEGKEPVHNGINTFGEAVILEMNRLGMMVDLSHVSVATMNDVLNVTKAPVIFSHSGAFSVCNNTRNVPDHVLRRLAENEGIIMVVFYNDFLNCRDRNNVTIKDVIRHIEHIRNLIGTDYIGIGSDYNGVKRVPTGLEDVSKFPELFAELLRVGWSPSDLEKLAGRNLLRVMRSVEKVKEELSYMKPVEEQLATELVPDENKQCVSEYDTILWNPGTKLAT